MCHPAIAWDFEWGKVIPKTKGTLSLLPQNLEGEKEEAPQIIRGGDHPHSRGWKEKGTTKVMGEPRNLPSETLMGEKTPTYEGPPQLPSSRPKTPFPSPMSGKAPHS